jgi:hypothetical protein
MDGLIRGNCNRRSEAAWAMSIRRLLKGDGFKPEEVAVLSRAFELALYALGLVDRDDPVCEIVARKVIEIGTKGIHDPSQIARAAVKQLGD